MWRQNKNKREKQKANKETNIRKGESNFLASKPCVINSRLVSKPIFINLLLD